MAGITNKEIAVMCKLKIRQRPLMSVAAASMLLSLLAAGIPNVALASVGCATGMGPSLDVVGPYAGNPLYIHVGETATVDSLVMFETGTCIATNVKSWLIYPNSSFAPV